MATNFSADFNEDFNEDFAIGDERTPLGKDRADWNYGLGPRYARRFGVFISRFGLTSLEIGLEDLCPKSI